MLLQVRQLLLDPAVNKEFARLRADGEEKARRIKALQEELSALTFTQDSKTGRMLMAKCRLLQVRPRPCTLFITACGTRRRAWPSQTSVCMHARSATRWQQCDIGMPCNLAATSRGVQLL